ncbi:DUF2147 domain-containing protein [Spirosoma linguale]|uniref:DUF2147 domain-containing protein n=1 Tax=Spirosoma linguale (strain ATCC 33905 / DSM 74 / LMG 10896 / Claus 1) TaxID=504472 RepID=D2QUB9_SPILD|nr:Protein of unknown function DUF2147 [Spirosoma linguale DSM 74]
MKTQLTTYLLVLTLAVSGYAQTNPSAILGEWLSPKKDSRIFIYKQGAAYFGKIMWGTGGSAKDEKNPNPALRSRDLIGAVILNDFTFDGSDTWQNGTIYDPRDGKTYSCKMTLKDPAHLNIRGYVGVSLFGRTEVWTKEN